MLTTRFSIGLLTALLLLAGCGGSQDEYRPVDPATAPPEEQLPESNDSQPAVEPRPFPDASTPDASTPDASTPDASTPDAGNEKMPAPQPVPETGTSQNESPDSLPSDAAATSESTTPAVTQFPTSLRDPALIKKSQTPLEIKLLIPHKEFTRESPSNALRITFDDIDLLKVCNMEPVPPDVMEYLPDWLKNLNGQKIVLRGWMFPSGRQEGISSFMFVRDNGICCFGRDPKVYDKLGVTMQSGQTTSYIAGRPFDVVGTLVIEPDIEGPDEGMWWLYRIENARVIDH